MTPVVIDIYKGNVVRDWGALKRQGIVGIIHKASEGASVRDPLYASRRAICEGMGFLWGAYHFNSRSSSIKDQVANFLSVAKPDATTLLCMDWEGDAKAYTASEARDFLLRVMDATGRQPQDLWIYSGNVARERVKTDAEIRFFGQFRLWHAQYGTTKTRINPAWQNWDLWQYSESGQLEGTGSLIDLNVASGTIEDLRWKWAPAYSGSAAPVRPPAPVPPVPVPPAPPVKPAPAPAPVKPIDKFPEPSIAERLWRWFRRH